jgi:hypothetical protein
MLITLEYRPGEIERQRLSDSTDHYRPNAVRSIDDIAATEPTFKPPN